MTGPVYRPRDWNRNHYSDLVCPHCDTRAVVPAAPDDPVMPGAPAPAWCPSCGHGHDDNPEWLRRQIDQLRTQLDGESARTAPDERLIGRISELTDAIRVLYRGWRSADIDLNGETFGGHMVLAATIANVYDEIDDELRPPEEQERLL